jgi:hypothetical protein
MIQEEENTQSGWGTFAQNPVYPPDLDDPWSPLDWTSTAAQSGVSGESSLDSSNKENQAVPTELTFEEFEEFFDNLDRRADLYDELESRTCTGLLRLLIIFYEV